MSLPYAELPVWSPDYAGRCLVNVLPSVAAAMGVPTWDDLLGLPAADRYVVVLVDGLGYTLLRDHRDDAPYLAGLFDQYAPMSSGLPSTTATSLTSLGTGLAPGRHGVVGYTCRIPGTDRLLNALKWDDEVDAVEWQPHANMLERLDAAGIATSVVNKADFENSGLTLCSQRGVDFLPVNSVWERLDVVAETSAARPRSLVYAYESMLDSTGHKHGCESPQWRDRLRKIDGELEALRDAIPDDAALVITADHGMVDLPADGRFDVDAPEAPADLLDDVVVFGGEARFRHLYVRSGAATDVAARWRAMCGDRAIVLTRDEAEDAGWFGPIDTAMRARIGDVLVASLGDFGVFSSRGFGVEMKMTGFHGSITPEETQVPLLVC